MRWGWGIGDGGHSVSGEWGMVVEEDNIYLSFSFLCTDLLIFTIINMP